MWDRQKRQRFEQLRQRETQLLEAEQAELAFLVQELEAAESAYLNGATAQLRYEREITEKQNRSLEDLVTRKKALVQRLGSVLADAYAERRAIESELASVLAANQGSHTED